MNEEIRTLIDSLRRGQYEDPGEKIDLLSAALREHRADVALLLSLLRAPQIPLRLAAVEACRGQTEQELVLELLKLAEDTEARVRKKLAAILEGFDSKPVQEAVRTLAQDSDEEVRQAAVKSSAGKPAFIELRKSTTRVDRVFKGHLEALLG